MIYTTKNQIHIISEINKELYTEFRTHFKKICNKNNNIELHISSCGGSMYYTHLILDLIQSSLKHIYAYVHNTISIGGYFGVASAASLICAYCNKIYIDNDASFLIHHSRTNSGIVNYDEDNIYFWMQHSNMDYSTAKTYLDNDLYMTSKECMTHGIVTDINYSEYELI